MVEKLQIDRAAYKDKVLGCWFGKNAGGTLGTPLERGFGQEEMFDVWWYPKLVPGGMPNDDLEIQLVWLQALKDRGLNITATDLAEYWLKCIWYNYDEYGLHKTNLRKGLLPPLSGWYNNWFKDCMGSPIRSEIWACIAPGLPHVAARYAYEDSICDHAGGESVYGEIFNASIESAAFIIDDMKTLVEIGLAAIPSGCMTAKAIAAAVVAYEGGLDWKAARAKVKDAAFNPVAQYSPINMGFQTIGMLYGSDFGDAMCKAVNCGWDTDCTGATVGSIWGIINGKSKLPTKWLEPLGNTLVVNKAIKNIHVHETIDDLTEDTCKIGEQVVAQFNDTICLGEGSVGDAANALAMIKGFLPAIKPLWNRPANVIEQAHTGLLIRIIYPEGPALLPGQKRRVELELEATAPTSVQASVSISVPAGFDAPDPMSASIPIVPTKASSMSFAVSAPAVAIQPRNTVTATIRVGGASEPVTVMIPLVGGFAWWTSPVYPGVKGIKGKYLPEKARGEKQIGSKGGSWTTHAWPDNALIVEPLFAGSPGVVYLRHYLYSAGKRNARVGIPNNNYMVLWINGRKVQETKRVISLRPNYSGDGSNYARVALKQGWNHVLVKLERGNDPIEAHFTVADHDDMDRGFDDLIQWRQPGSI
ncbi:MAG: ADP-ribosylglycohydrolase family protein [Candidatus Lokiarchaeota archaeon]|nr:ADP-ribosylglycohydrolase family protein [Candidatus Lokiarchaeota archaeon]